MKKTNPHGTTAPRLFQKDFTLVVIGQIISLFGNAILRFALPLYVLQQSGSAALFGLVSASAFIPMVIMSPIGGIIADRVNKQRIMVVLDFLTAGLIGVFMLLMGQVSIVPLVVVMLMLLYGIQGAYSPAVQASMPVLAAGENLLPANAVVNLVQSLAGLLGPVAGGLLYGQFGLWPILAVSCGCFAFSAIIELFIVIPHQKRAEKETVWGIISTDMRTSVRFIVKDKPVMARVIVLIFCINLFMSAMLIIGMPVIITDYLGMSSQLYGVSQGALAAGGLLGGIFAGVFSKKLNVRNAYLLLLMCSVGIFPMALVLLAGAPALASYLVLTVMGAFLMACATLFSIQMLAFVQGETPPEIVGKVVSFLMAISLCAQPIGQALYGVLFENFAPGSIVLGAAILSSIVALYSRAAFRQLKSAVTAASPAA